MKRKQLGEGERNGVLTARRIAGEATKAKREKGDENSGNLELETLDGMRGYRDYFSQTGH